MFKKINNIIFIVLFLAVLFVPLLLTRWESGGVSKEENRTLAEFPAVVTEGQFNMSFTKDFETWFMDHLGLRQKLIGVNKTLMQNVFDRSLSTNDWKTGKTGDSIYASAAIIEDFAHINLRSEASVERIGNSYQKVSDWLAAQGIDFYYVQCVDKHTIYPERFIASVQQIGDVSKTDQILNYLQNKTSVNAIYFKQVLIKNKETYPVFSHWGDATHWTGRGAYISYQHMMEQINKNLSAPLKVLSEKDYTISYKTNEGPNGQTEQEEVFTITNPQVQKGDVAVMGQWASDRRHSVWKNPNAENGKRLLLLGDSYFNNYLIDDIAESFSEVWLVWADYVSELPEIIDLYQPDIVIFECAERVDRSANIYNFAQTLPAEN